MKKRALEILDEGWDVEETEEIVDILAMSSKSIWRWKEKYSSTTSTSVSRAKLMSNRLMTKSIY
jgi:hypothetical protein